MENFQGTKFQQIPFDFLNRMSKFREKFKAKIFGVFKDCFSEFLERIFGCELVNKVLNIIISKLSIGPKVQCGNIISTIVVYSQTSCVLLTDVWDRTGTWKSNCGRYKYAKLNLKIRPQTRCSASIADKPRSLCAFWLILTKESSISLVSVDGFMFFSKDSNRYLSRDDCHTRFWGNR